MIKVIMGVGEYVVKARTVYEYLYDAFVIRFPEKLVS
jgi:hypothetical protein